MSSQRGRGRVGVSPYTYGGLFVITLSSLMYEIGLTRIFSVTMWYHFAFVAISIALFGTTGGALLVYLRPKWFPHESVKRQLDLLRCCYAVAIRGVLGGPAPDQRSDPVDVGRRCSPSSSRARSSPIPFVLGGRGRVPRAHPLPRPGEPPLRRRPHRRRSRLCRVGVAAVRGWTAPASMIVSPRSRHSAPSCSRSTPHVRLQQVVAGAVG